MPIDSLYNKIRYAKESRINMGYDYKSNGLIDKWLSPRIYMVTGIKGFLDNVDPILIGMLDSIKRVQNYWNFTIDKNDNRRNF